MDRHEDQREMEQARLTFRRIVAEASEEELRRPSNGTRWTNRQLLFHMVFGYLIVRTLLPLVRTLGRLGWSHRFAATLNAVWRPFHLINYLGSVGGGLLRPATMADLMDRTIYALQHRIATETDASLALTMHFPLAWDPYFKPTMTVMDVYHYGTLHFDHHRHQLSC